MKYFRLKVSSGSAVIRLNPSKGPLKAPEIKTGYLTWFLDEKKEAKEIPGLDIPNILMKKPQEKEMTREERNKLNIRYSLIPSVPKEGDKIFAFAQIALDPKEGELVYKVFEPKLDETKMMIIEQVKNYIQEKVDIDFNEIRKYGSARYIEDIFERALRFIKVPITDAEKEVMKYYIYRDFIGLEKLEAVINDKQIEDISCDGAGIPIYIYHRDSNIGSVKTNIVFYSRLELDRFVSKLAERTGKTISISKPLLDGSLPDGSRIQATLGSDIARLGSNFTIRKFTDKPLTPTHVLEFRSCDLKMLALFWFMIENGASLLISGSTATGKTSLLNVLSMFIKPQLKIVSIEDTAELRLPHPHWVPEVARASVSDTGKVDMFELLRESLRQRPDRIIVGEVRGKEAYVMFQQMATGHPGMSTMHADSFPKLMDRLVTPPIQLPPSLIQNLDAVIFIKRIKRGPAYIRRISDVVEIAGYDRKRKFPITVNTISWNPKTDDFDIVHKSPYLLGLSEKTGMSEKDINSEIRDRAKVLKWLYDKGIRDYRKVGEIINLFYTSKDFIMEKVEEEI